jgi:hypothetical protein
MRSFPLLASLLLLLVAASAGADDCVDRFRAAVKGTSLAMKAKLAMSLPPKAVECLFKNASGERVEPSFFIDSGHRSSKRIQAWLGLNSLPVGRRFEKHFFAAVTDAGEGVFGYNEGPINHLLSSPGFFAVLPNDRDRSEIAFEYGDLKRALAGIDLSSYEGAKFKSVRNNSGNLIFGGLSDVMKAIDPDVAIGVARKKGKTQSYFLLVRKP